MANQTDQMFSASNPQNQQTNSGAIQVDLPMDADNVFNPNNMLSAIQTFNTFNNVANQMFGLEVRWFRAVPQQRSKDIMFKEYTLSCVEEEPLCLKAVVPDGNFPDSKYQYDLMGLEYEVPTEIQIDKRYWESIAGFGTAPQKKDIVYMVIPNKLYQVESSYLKRGFMEQETTWVINLRKYMPEASRKEGEALRQTIDMYTVSEQEIFGDAQAAEYKKLKDDKQMSPFNTTERDKHKSIHEDLLVVASDLEMHGTIFAQAYYDMTSADGVLVEYFNPVGDQITTNRDRALTAWVMPRDVTEEYDVTSITYTGTNYAISVRSNKTGFSVGEFFTIQRKGALNFYAEILEVLSPGVYSCKIDDEVVSYLRSISTNWMSATGYKAKVKKPICLIHGTGESHEGFLTAYVHANQFIKINYGTQAYVAVMDSRLEDNTWYGIVINIGNTWNQHSVYVWEEHPSDSAAKIRIKFYDTMQLTSQKVFLEKYELLSSSSYMTNIRLFMTTIEEEKQPLELLAYFTKDAEQALILDNCDLKFRAPYISKQR